MMMVKCFVFSDYMLYTGITIHIICFICFQAHWNTELACCILFVCCCVLICGVTLVCIMCSHDAHAKSTAKSTAFLFLYCRRHGVFHSTPFARSG